MALGAQAPPHESFSHLVPVLKKVKHRLVENMSSGTADALGLSRAILCNGESPSPSPHLQSQGTQAQASGGGAPWPPTRPVCVPLAWAGPLLVGLILTSLCLPGGLSKLPQSTHSAQ